MVNLFNKNLLENSLIAIISDHGLNYFSIHYLTKSPDFFTEMYNPMLFIIVSDKLKNGKYKKRYTTLNENQQKFIVPYDIYNSLNNIIYGKEYIKNYTINRSEYGKSLFEKIKSERNCYDFKKEFSYHSKFEKNCKCINYK